MIEVINLILIALVISFTAYLGIKVYMSKSDREVNRVFGLLCIVFNSWIIVDHFLYTDYLTSSQTFLNRLDLAIVSIGVILLIRFVRIFPKEIFPLPRWLITLADYYFVVLSIVTLGTPFIVESAYQQSYGSNFNQGPLFYVYIASVSLLALYVIAILILKNVMLRGKLRTQNRLVSYGIAIVVVANLVLNALLPLTTGTFAYSRFGTSSIVFFVFLTTYAIVTTHLFDIRVFIRRTIVYSTLLLVVFVSYSLIVFLATSLFQSGVEGTFDYRTFIASMIAALVVSVSYDPLRRWLQDRTDKWLFKKEFEQQAVISGLGKHLNDVIAMDEALEIVMQTISHVLHLHHAVTYVFQPAENSGIAVKRVKQTGYSNTANLILDDKDFTLSYFSQNGQTLLTQDLAMDVEREKILFERNKNKQDGQLVREHAIKQAVLRKLEQLDVAVAVPLQLNNQPIGLIFLSEKLNGEGYHQQDLALLELVGAQAISSIQKAKLYEGDQMKSEFVSIASHELLTPVSAIEGYLSMILEEHIGKVDPQAEEYLTKVYSSAKRLSALIKDLLSVSRIESGKMKVVQQQLDIDKAIKETLDQLHFIAENKKLELIYHQPYQALPPVWADPDRTAQILVNLVSNAIKYTPSGSVTITPKLDPHTGMVSISVADTGLGMSKVAIQHLFNKFYRVDTPETAGILGTGLGLYITKSLVEKMGGTITVKSTEGKGSNFTFTLPLFKIETSLPSA